MRRLVDFIRRFVKYLRFCKKGGYVNLTISQIQYGEILKGKKVIVTGGSDGIGLSIAEKFLSVGAEVLVTGRNVEKLEQVEKKFNNERFHVMQWDISKCDMLHTYFLKAVDILGGVDIFVNNAAMIKIDAISMDLYDSVINTNMKSVYFSNKEAAEYMHNVNEEKGGKIINISSLNAFQNGIQPYWLSKNGVNAITRGFAKEYADKNIIVNAIAPGFVASSINYQDITINAYDDKSLNNRITTTEEIAELALFLASDASNAIIGQVISCDGGALL